MKNDTILLLERQIEEARRTISADGYPMSIGELTNIYRDGELKIRPEFQRLYRWSNTQKSRLIESILLGIPLPSIFVSQTEKGTWEIVDGLQRVSTILELQGELINEEKKKLPQLILDGTKYLPNLEGLSWKNEDKDKSLTEAQRIDIKRSKIDIKIIKRGSSPATKFDLFQRLNSYGTKLTAQETRSALLVAVSPDFYSWVENLAKYEPFTNSVSLSDRLIEERFDLELILRFLLLHNRPSDKISSNALKDLSQLLDDESVELASEYPKKIVDLEKVFKATFDLIYKSGGDIIFKKWNEDKNEFGGSFLGTAFEIFALGVGYNIANDISIVDDLLNTVKKLWSSPTMKGGYATGKSTEKRLSIFIPRGRELVKK